MRQASVLAALVALAFCGGSQASELENLLEGRGMWLQSPARFRDSDVRTLKELGIRRMHVMVTYSPLVRKHCRNSSPIAATASASKLKKIITLFGREKIDTIVTAYIPPTREAIDSLTDQDSGLLAPLVMAGAKAVEYDLEGGWSKSTPCGFASHDEAVDYLFSRTKAIKPGLPVGITTHLGRARDPKVGLAKADWVSIQAYSACRPDRCVKYSDANEGPGIKQKRVKDAMAGYNKPIVIGIAAFQQAWPGKTVQGAMAATLEAVNSLEATFPNYLGYSYWSTTWALKTDSAEYLFIKATANDK